MTSIGVNVFVGLGWGDQAYIVGELVDQSVCYASDYRSFLRHHTALKSLGVLVAVFYTLFVQL